MQYFQDIDVTFRASGETDGGMSFSAGVDLDENGAFTTNDDGGATIGVSGGFGNVTMGDTDGASDWALTETAIGGAIADDHTAHAGYSGNSGLDGKEDGQILRWDYSLGAVGVGVSLEQAADGAASTDDDIVQVGLKYSMDMGGSTVGLGVGFADAGNQTVTGAAGDSDHIALSLSMKTTGGITGVVNFTDGSSAGRDASHLALGLGMTMDALTVGVNYGEHEVAGATASGQLPQGSNRDAICKSLANSGVPTAIYYPVPMHRQPPYAHYPVSACNLPVTMDLCDHVLALPMHPYLETDQQALIASSLKDALATA
jgi:outer membrane protein OmpU